MVEQVTKGIKISVETKFMGTSYQNDRLLYAFSYNIAIENQSNGSVQLMNRHWKIFDSLNDIKIINGPGVVGLQPILKPTEKHNYQSHCFLISSRGAMKGYYEMVDFVTNEIFKVHIPTFQFMVSEELN